MVEQAAFKIPLCVRFIRLLWRHKKSKAFLDPKHVWLWSPKRNLMLVFQTVLSGLRPIYSLFSDLIGCEDQVLAILLLPFDDIKPIIRHIHRF